MKKMCVWSKFIFVVEDVKEFLLKNEKWVVEVVYMSLKNGINGV